MHSQTSVLVSLLALTTTTLAQSTVQKIFFPATNDDAWAGRVVNVASDLTTYAIACTSGGLSCVTGVSVSVTEGPTSFAVASQTSLDGASVSISENCKIAGTTSATCVAAVSGSLDGETTAITTTTTIGTADFTYKPVTITAGASLLSASGNAAAPMVTGMGVMGAVGLGIVAIL